ncbi:nucleotide sugar dehydrogenase [Frigidibacter sp. MR17.24]|uniref:nucleotide sugar dehydrogenase n=1 Tax=Frigidibacter sp. MR17.24 TaxID=3127345 RepID=UPI003012C4B7
MTTAFSLVSGLRDRLQSREARVMTIGLGYVGLPLALTVHETGFPVTGFDLDAERVARINAGERVISYFPETRIASAVATGRFAATADPARLAEADVVLICVPTPLTPAREPDLSYLRRAAETLARHLRHGQLVVLESTVWPGATATVLRPILEAGGLRAGTDFFLAFSPEREDPGNATFTTRTIPKVVGADDPQSLQLVHMFYDRVVERTVPVGSIAAAEAVKLVENSFRTVNIALVNEMKGALEAMGVDVWEVIAAAATKPFGYMPFWPGPGIGGDCIPVSPAYLSWRAGDVGAQVPLVDLARHTNDAAPAALAARILSDIAQAGRPAAGARILVCGISYKRDVEDTRESPALGLMRALEAGGAVAAFHDPFFPVLPVTRDHPDLAGRVSVPVTPEAVSGFDAVVVTTDHTGVDYAVLARHARILFDTRNVIARLGLVPAARDLRKV